MTFTWDENKRRSNRQKHGFDFIDAWKVFESTFVEDLDDREDYGEERWAVFGLINERLVKLVHTREGDTIRVISLRKAACTEELDYEDRIGNRLGSR